MVRCRYRIVPVQDDERPEAVEIRRARCAVRQMAEEAEAVAAPHEESRAEFCIIEEAPEDRGAGKRTEVRSGGDHRGLGIKIGQLDAEGLKGETAASGGLAARKG
jgi:hypothetical protein